VSGLEICTLIFFSHDEGRKQRAVEGSKKHWILTIQRHNHSIDSRRVVISELVNEGLWRSCGGVADEAFESNPFGATDCRVSSKGEIGISLGLGNHIITCINRFMRHEEVTSERNGNVATAQLQETIIGQCHNLGQHSNSAPVLKPTIYSGPPTANGII
jgi:hypothetical protein